jgi:ParB-like chromosome segregation protein Spo0J
MTDLVAKITPCSPAQIRPNPWQPREQEDPVHVADLAQSILAEGLLQIPVGRKNAEHLIELAFGHSRLAAWRLLNQIAVLQRTDGMDLAAFPGLAEYFARSVGNELSIDERSQWAFFPVILRELTDEDMFREAITENLHRNGLNPIEKARAMARYRDEFEHTSLEIGALFGYSDSGVRNLMRLLKLPERIQSACKRGDLTEGQARALIPLYDLPADVRAEAEDSGELKPSDILEVALSGTSPAQISALVARFIAKFVPAKPGAQQLTIDDLAEPEPSVSVETVTAPVEETAVIETLPAPAPEPIPPMMASVSMETVQEEEEEAQEPEQAVITPPVQAAQPKPEAPKPQPAPAQRAKPVELPQPAAVTPAAPAAAPKAEPAEQMTWAKSSIALTITYWPDDGSEQGRQVMVGARLNQGPPKMLMLRESQVELPVQLKKLVEIMKYELGGQA